MKRTHCLLISLLFMLSVLTVACAPKGNNDMSVKGWDMSPEAQTTYYYLLLEDAKREQDIKVGEFAIEQLLKTESSPTIYVEAANFYWHLGEVAKAISVLEKGQAKLPKNGDIELMLAQLYLADKQTGNAADQIGNYLKSHPDDAQTRQELAGLLIQGEEYHKALKVLNEIPEAKRTAVSNYFIAKALAGTGDRKKAIRVLNRVLDQDPELMEAYAELAYLYELEQDYVAAEKTYSRILKMGESSQELWLRLIDLNLKLNNPQKAYKLSQKGPNQLSFALGAGTLFVDQGFYTYAEKILTPLLKKNPETYDIYFYLALLNYKGKQNFTKAAELLQKIPMTSNYYDKALRFRCHMLFQSGKQHEALALAKEGREMYSNEKSFWTLEASLLEEAKQYGPAAQVLSQAQEQWPDDQEILFFLGVLKEKQGNKKAAWDIMESILELNPDHADALNYLGYTLADEGRELNKAFELVKKAMNMKPNNGYIRDSMAWVLFKMGKYNEAWKYIRQAVRFAQEDPTIWEHYGDIAAKVGNRQEAAVGYKNSLRTHPKDKNKIKAKLNAL